MEDLDFISKPAPPTEVLFDSSAALAFFQSAGKALQLAAGEVIFAENQKSSLFQFHRNKMYLLLEGSIEISVQGKPFATLHAGEIFGEMAALTQMPRSSTATTVTPCRLLALDDKQFKQALEAQPEFALTLMVMMTHRLRDVLAKLKAIQAFNEAIDTLEFVVLDKKLLSELTEELDEHAVIRYEAGKVIAQEGHAGVFMYIVLEGLINISIQGQVVEEVGPGGLFGELALLERSERLASAVAETESVVLAINRETFLNLVKDNAEFGLSMLSALGERLRFMITSYSEQLE